MVQDLSKQALHLEKLGLSHRYLYVYHCGLTSFVRPETVAEYLGKVNIRNDVVVSVVDF